MESSAKRRKLNPDEEKPSPASPASTAASAATPSAETPLTEATGSTIVIEDVPKVPGLKYAKKFVSRDEEQAILAELDKREWNTSLKRRTMHFGYEYDYTKKSLDNKIGDGTLPDFAKNVMDRMIQQKILEERPDQLIINEYEPGQGITKHIDKPQLFEDRVVSISLGSGCTMDFELGSTKQGVYLERRSLVLLSGDSRYKWTHAIVGRKSDKVNGLSVARSRRVSLTFRKMKRN